MTQNPESAPRSLRFKIDEVLSGMLATIEKDSFVDDTEKLGEVFKGLSQEAPLFEPFGALVGEIDFSAALDGALKSLVSNGVLQHEPGRYRLSPEGRARCVASKRTLFNASNIKDLEVGARYFEEHGGA